MNKTLLVLAVLAGAVAPSTAGDHNVAWNVSVSPSSRSAFGSLGYAYNSPDSRQEVGCETMHSSSSHFAFCYAGDATGQYVSCMTSDANLIAEVRSLKSDSNIWFDYDASGTCTEVLIETTSRSEPKR